MMLSPKSFLGSRGLTEVVPWAAAPAAAWGHPVTSAAASVALSPLGTLALGTLFLPPLKMCHRLYVSYFLLPKGREQSNLEEFNSACGSRCLRHHGAGAWQQGAGKAAGAGS